MKNPWNIDNAFDPMFDESIWLKRKDNQQLTTKAAVFIDNTAVPLDDDMMETDCEQLNFLVKRCDWPFVQKLQRGDTLKREDFNGKKYTIQDVMNDNALGLVIKARSC